MAYINSGDPFVKNLADVLGIPDNATKFSLHVDYGGIVKVDVTQLVIKNGETIKENRRFKLIESEGL